MRAVVMERRGQRGAVAAGVRSVQDWPDVAKAPPGGVLIRTEYSALNHMDLWLGAGLPGIDRPYPLVSGTEACGVVESVGAGADASWQGRRVIFNAACEQPTTPLPGDSPDSTSPPVLHLIGEHTQGTHAAQFVAPAANLADIGDMPGEQAAAFGLAHLTAYSMMIGKGGLRPGQAVLITGIGGGVATAALGIARWLGCKIGVTSQHQWKLERALELGADHPVLDDGQDWSRDVRAWTAKRGVDMVVDTVGQAVHLSSVKSLARGGAFVSAGATSGPAPTTDLARLFWNQLRFVGSTMGTRSEFLEVVALFRAGQLAPTIDKVFAWDDGRAAYERMERGEQMGKIVLDWTD